MAPPRGHSRLKEDQLPVVAVRLCSCNWELVCTWPPRPALTEQFCLAGKADVACIPHSVKDRLLNQQGGLKDTVPPKTAWCRHRKSVTVESVVSPGGPGRRSTGPEGAEPIQTPTG